MDWTKDIHSGIVYEKAGTAWKIKKGPRKTWWARRDHDHYVLGPFKTLKALKELVKKQEISDAGQRAFKQAFIAIFGGRA